MNINVSPTAPCKEINLITYHTKFNTNNLVIHNNSSPSFGVLQKNNIVYQFNCPLGDCISDKNVNNMFVSVTTTTMTRRLKFHLNHHNSISGHLKEDLCSHSQFRYILVKNTKVLH